MRFEYQQDAQRSLHQLRERFAKFGLELHPDRTRLIEFARCAFPRRMAQGLEKQEKFDHRTGNTDAAASARE